METPRGEPTDARGLEDLARQRFSAGDPAGAADLLRRAIAIDPTSTHLYINLGAVLASIGQFDEAIPLLEGVLQLQPDSAPLRANVVQAYVGRANAMFSAGRFEEAVPSFQSALLLEPSHRWAQNNLAVALQELGRLDEALQVCHDAVTRHPDFPEAWYNLGRICQDLDLQTEAAEAFKQALLLRPDFAQARNNLALTLQTVGRFDDAVSEYRRAIELDPGYEDPQVNIGIALRNAGRIDEAVKHYRDLLAARPGLIDARWNLGNTLLLKGELEEGFRAAEARRQIPRLECNRTFPRPQWEGEELAGKTILLHAEQGFGDAIQFFRYARMVRGRGARVLLLCQAGLKRLFEDQSGVDQVVAEGEGLPSFDVHCPLMTLPVIFRTSLATIPSNVPYLKADLSLVERWGARVRSLAGGRKIGLAWAGNPRQANDRNRSMPAEALEPLGRIAGVRYVSLQKPRPAKGDIPASLDLIDFTDELSDFAETAALMENLDLIITVDTSVAHLAGALGRPVWTMLSSVADWRYLLGRQDCPWYRSMRLFRQPVFGNWGSVILDVVEAVCLESGSGGTSSLK